MSTKLNDYYTITFPKQFKILTFLFYRDGVYEMARFGQGQGPIVMNYVHCTGRETKITDCNFDLDTSDCTHLDDVSISCHNSV